MRHLDFMLRALRYIRLVKWVSDMMVCDFIKIPLATWWGMMGRGRLQAVAVVVTWVGNSWGYGSDGGPRTKLMWL